MIHKYDNTTNIDLKIYMFNHYTGTGYFITSSLIATAHTLRID